MAKLSLEQIRDLLTKFKQLRAKLLHKNIADFSKYAEEAADFKWKAISIKMLAYKKAVDAKLAKSTPAKIEKVRAAVEKLKAACAAVQNKLIADIQKAKAAEAKKEVAEAKKKAVQAKKKARASK